jgi:hypothetical protein
MTQEELEQAVEQDPRREAAGLLSCALISTGSRILRPPMIDSRKVPTGFASGATAAEWRSPLRTSSTLKLFAQCTSFWWVEMLFLNAFGSRGVYDSFV